MSINSSGYLICAVPDGNNWNEYTSNTVVSLGSLTNTICTFNGTNLNFYMNGNLDKSQAIAVTLVNSNRNNLTIGNYFGDINNFAFNGTIDEVRIYNRSLSASEVQNLYELGSYHINWSNNGNYSKEQTCYDNKTKIKTI